MPKSVATRSRWNTPASPQLSAPMMTSAAAITSRFFMFISVLPVCGGGSLQPPFDPTANLFYFKEQWCDVFPVEKYSPANRSQQENGFTMASDTTTAGLKKYGIGSKLRRLRLRKSMGL